MTPREWAMLADRAMLTAMYFHQLYAEGYPFRWEERAREWRALEAKCRDEAATAKAAQS